MRTPGGLPSMRSAARSGRSRAHRAYLRRRRERHLKRGCPMCHSDLQPADLGPDLVLALCRAHYRAWLDWSDYRVWLHSCQVDHRAWLRWRANA